MLNDFFTKNTKSSIAVIIAFAVAIVLITSLLYVIIIGPYEFQHKYFPSEETKKEKAFAKEFYLANQVIIDNNKQILNEEVWNSLHKDIKFNILYDYKNICNRLTNVMQEYALNNKEYDMYEQVEQLNAFKRKEIPTWKQRYSDYLKTFEVFSLILNFYLNDYIMILSKEHLQEK